MDSCLVPPPPAFHLWGIGFIYSTITIMKTQVFNFLKVATRGSLVTSLLIIMASCKGGDDSAGNGGAPAKAPDVDIHTAVVTGNEAALRQHIQAGTNLNERDPFGGSSPLISAAVFGKPEMARILLDAGVDIDFQNNEGSTALHTAAFFCRPEIVKMLLDAGADKTIRNKYNATAYEMVAGPFKDIKNAYDMMGQMLGPMGLQLDYPYIEKTRPEIARILK